MPADRHKVVNLDMDGPGERRYSWQFYTLTSIKYKAILPTVIGEKYNIPIDVKVDERLEIRRYSNSILIEYSPV